MDGHLRFGPGAPDVDLIEVAQTAIGEPIGQVDTSTGDAVIIRADGETVNAEAGTPVFLGDVVETKGEGSIGLVFVDDTTFSLAEDGRMTIDELVYDPTTNEGSSLFNVTKGVFTFVSGEIAKTSVDAMKIETSVATIGIRGTAGGGRVINPQADDPNSPLPPSGTFSNFRDPVTGQAGEMNIATPTGSQTLNGVNATTSVPNPFVPPSTPVILPGSALQAVFGKSIAVLPTPPARRGQEGAEDELGDSLTEGDNPQSGGAQAEAETAAANAFAQALADGVDPVAALAIAAQTAELTMTRFGLDPTQLDNFSIQNAIDDVISGITNTIVGDPTALISGGGLAAYSGLIDATTGNETIDQAVQQIVQQVAQTIGSNINEQILAAAGDDTDDLPLVSISDVTIAHNVSGTQTVTLTNGANDVITGTSGGEIITLMGGGASQGGGGDIVDLAGGTDTLILNSTTNTLAFSNVETLQLAYNSTSDITLQQSLTWQTAGSLTISNQDGSTAGPRAPLSFLGNSTNQNLTLSFLLNNTNASNSSFDLAGGTDSISLAAGTNTIASAQNIESWVLANATNTFTFTGTQGGETITGGTGADTIVTGSGVQTISTSGGGDTITAGNGADNITLGGGSDHLNYDSTSHFGDSITSFTAGAGGDVFDINTSVTGGNGSASSTFVNDHTNNDVSSNAGAIFEFQQATISMTGTVTSLTAQATALATLQTANYTTAANATNIIVLYDNATTANAAVVQFNDADGEGDVDSGEVSLIAFASSVGADALDANNFDGFT